MAWMLKLFICWNRRCSHIIVIVGPLFLLLVTLAFTYYNSQKKPAFLSQATTPQLDHSKETAEAEPPLRTKPSTENRLNEVESDGKQNNIALKLAGAGSGSHIMRRLSNFVRSICRHATIFLRFHVLADHSGKSATVDVFNKIRQDGLCGYGFELLHYDINVLLQKAASTIRPIIDSIQDARGRGRHTLFFLPLVLHQLLPEEIERIILFDSDFFVKSDIKQLFAHFDNFTEDNCFGAAYVQQPTYMYACREYRASHPDTRLGGPPPEGVPGYNGGLVMLHLKNLRKSALFNQILRDNAAKQYAEKYQFRYWLGEQDFFILVDMEHHELFYVLPCSWNRQTTYYLGLPEFAEFYDKFHHCPEPIHAYHGNAGARLPNE